MTSAPPDILFVIAAGQEYGPELRRLLTPLITGVRPIEAAVASTRHLCELRSHGRKPALVVSLGSAGSARHRAGTLWQISAVSWRDMDAPCSASRRASLPSPTTPPSSRCPRRSIPSHRHPLDRSRRPRPALR